MTRAICYDMRLTRCETFVGSDSEVLSPEDQVLKPDQLEKNKHCLLMDERRPTGLMHVKRLELIL